MNLTVCIFHAESGCLNFTHEVTLGEEVYEVCSESIRTDHGT